MQSIDTINTTFDLYFEQISKIKFYNKLAIFATGLSGTWWLWIFGIISFESSNNFSLIFYGAGSLLIIFVIASSIADDPKSRFNWIIRIIAIVGIIQLNRNNINPLLSIFVFAIASIFQDLLSPITYRIIRTQRFANFSHIKPRLLETIKSNTRYIEDRIYWLQRTIIIISILGLISIAIIELFSIITLLVNISQLQYISLIAIIILITFALSRILSNTNN